MSANSKIEWTDHTFNPWVGCMKVSPACDHCYAEAWAKRTGQVDLWRGRRHRTSLQNWNQPRKWNQRHKHFFAEHGRKQRVFCASLSDVFDNSVPEKWRDDLWQLIRDTPNLDWLLLTKRPQNIAKMLPADWGAGYPNVWLGTTVENQAEADRRIPLLLQTPAAVRFLSCEPLLGAVNLVQTGAMGCNCPDVELTNGTTEESCSGQCTFYKNAIDKLGRIDWVIVGGESGPGARPMHPDWARDIRDQCAAAAVPFFFKQWGEWRESVPGEIISGRQQSMIVYGHKKNVGVLRFGKKSAGRILDGRIWGDFPIVRGS
ncbi:hypothetical protein SD70_29625 [Gordoniibacillus kamchatkensis]|uniref:Uncharacterized protein n=1 Tax=Gordoniibacillus kamchatkensis TaxID=1590651 RepID=A0ABR5AA73_9BACL|nr:phage Gp37/Gp68 family protein [Paenibacillus sp. VKM B-2647]KIL37951.1 hypothetical protein SD70_29625 [Paenibacillus sp. VKM B-2647]